MPCQHVISCFTGLDSACLGLDHTRFGNLNAFKDWDWIVVYSEVVSRFGSAVQCLCTSEGPVAEK